MGNVKKTIRCWVFVNFKEPGVEIKEVQVELDMWQSQLEHILIIEEIMRKEKELDRKIQYLERKEEEEWRFCSRNLWLKGGDMNTKYFHNQCKDR